jgi:hypothetical protein
MSDFVEGDVCLVHTKSRYLQGKYGEPPYKVRLDVTDVEAWGMPWWQVSLPATMLFAMRVGLDGPKEPLEAPVWYAKVPVGEGISLGECFYESELEKVEAEL